MASFEMELCSKFGILEPAELRKRLKANTFYRWLGYRNYRLAETARLDKLKPPKSLFSDW